MRHALTVLAVAALTASSAAAARQGYTLTGKSGAMHLVSVVPAEKANEDVYRMAVADNCAGKAVCQVLFWVGAAPKALPMTDAQVDAKLVHWQQNLNTGLRRWMVKCDSTTLFSDDRSCV